MIRNFSIIEYMDDSDYSWEQIPEYDAKKCEFLLEIPSTSHGEYKYDNCEKPATWVSIDHGGYHEYFCPTHAAELIRRSVLTIVNNDEER